jgi:hypothetical protein
VITIRAEKSTLLPISSLAAALLFPLDEPRELSQADRIFEGLAGFLQYHYPYRSQHGTGIY